MKTLLILTCALNCGPALAAGNAAPAAGGDIVVAATATLTVDQIYNAQGLRDPFAAVSGQASTKTKAAPDKTAKPAKPTIDKLVLSGILLDSKGKQAALYDSLSGQTYFVYGKKLYNQNKSLIEGVSAIIQNDNSVTVISADQSRTLKLSDRKKTGS